jgi:DNA-binding SARP family transcriptional activator
MADATMDTAKDGPAIRVRLLGPASVTKQDGAPLPGLAVGKPLALLAYLAIKGRARREELVALLWGDLDESRARNAFRQSLHRLRGAVGPWLNDEGGLIAIDPRGGVWIDVHEFELAAEAGQSARALALYRGDFLEGFELSEPSFVQWVDVQRSRLGTIYQRLLIQATRQAMERGAADEAIRLAVSLTASTPFDTDAALLQASALVAAGRSAEATDSLRRFAERLETELALPVPRQVKEMLDRLASADAERDTPAARAARREAGDRQTREAVFVGRSDELALFGSAFLRLSNEEGSTLIVLGESGVGKTALVKEAVKRAAAMRKVKVLFGADRMGALIPFAAVADALRPLVENRAVAGASPHLLAEASRLLPELRDRFTLPEVGPIADDPARLRFFEGIAALIDAVAYEQPVALVLDDMQNASGATAELVAYLSGRLAGSPVLLVIVCRRAESPPPILRRLGLGSGGESPSGAVSVVDVDRLSEADTLTLVSELPAGALLAPAERARVAGMSDGNPLRTLDLLRRAAAGETLSTVPVPIRDLLWTRVVGCSPSQRRLFLAVALLERPASLRLLAAAAHLPEAAVYDAATALEQKGLVREDESGQLMLAHDFEAGFVLELGGTSGRSLLAGWVADALAAHDPDASAELTRLYALAGRGGDAFVHARAAALRAAAVGSTSDALRLLDIARSFAPTPANEAEIDAMVAAFGAGGPLLLPGATPPAEAAPVDEPVVEAHETPKSTTATPQPDAPGDATRSPAQPTRPRRLRYAVALLVIAGALSLALVGREVRLRTTRALLPVDTLVLAGLGEGRDVRYRVTPDFTIGPPHRRPAGEVAWTDSLSLPFISPQISPAAGGPVAVLRVTGSGTDAYLISINRRDTVPIAVGPGDDIVMDWAPDGKALLLARARMLPDGGYDSDLFAYRIDDRSVTPIDTAASRSVMEARWSPDGTHVAWVSRIGADHQREVFVAEADGAGRRAFSPHAGEDYRIAWSPGGEFLAFTSERTGAAEIYVGDIRNSRRWQLTFDSAGSDRATFSSDGRWIAFEQSRDRAVAVYVVPAFGGAARQVTPPGQSFTIDRWRRGDTTDLRYLDRITATSVDRVAVGDTATIVARGFSRNGVSAPLTALRWSLVDTVGTRFVSGDGTSPAGSATRRVVGEKAGVARVVVSAGGWRSDTALVAIGTTKLTLVDEKFTETAATAWRLLGNPFPSVRAGVGRDGGPGAVLASDLEWESGILSRQVFPVAHGLSVESWVAGPFNALTLSNRTFSMALVAPDPEEAILAATPQFLRLASIAWLGQEGRMSYTVGTREAFTEPVSALGQAAGHVFQMTVQSDGRVAFYVDGRLRHLSPLSLVDRGGQNRAQLWLASRGAGETVVVDDIAITLQPPTPGTSAPATGATGRR